jgi:peroxiredoxin
MKITPIRTTASAALFSVCLIACNSGSNSQNTEGVALDDTTSAFEIGDATPPQLAEVGAPAPNFSLQDLDGNRHKLSDHKGKIVVLEWFNPKCPFVVYAHEEGGPLHELGDRWASEGVVWYAINSGAPGKQGAGLELNQQMKQEFGFNYPVLLDETGETGRKYQAMTTPHMYVINAEGTLVYAGGLDNAGFGKVADGGEMIPYVEQVLDDLAAGRSARVQTSKPYGCSVKYAN